MLTNASNPINSDPAVPVHWIQEINRNHREVKHHIAIASEGSLALEQVRVAQYAMAVSELRHAIDKVVDLQLRTAELAIMASPSVELDELKAAIGLP